jgi:sialate O-acetylesterase
MPFRPLTALLLTASVTTLTQADVTLPAIFGDHMVLQQEIALPVWGWADPGEAVAVTFAGHTARTTTDATGNWRLTLPRVPANGTAQTLTVKGRNNTVTFADVLVGDVWLCSGQSNMEFQMFRGQTPDSGAGVSGGPHDIKETLPKANDAQLRLFHVKRATSFTPLKDVQGRWKVCTPESVKDFSAVGYYFGRDLRTHLGQPIGMIESAWGATSVTFWASLPGMEKRPAAVPESTQWRKEHQTLVSNYENDVAAYPALRARYEADVKRWTDEVYNNSEYKNLRETWSIDSKKARAEHRPLPPKPEPSEPEPVKPRDPEGRVHAGTLFNGMIAPLTPYALKGVIWYQGEAHTNYENWNKYEGWFTTLIEDWREQWGQGDFPFLFVQLAAYGNKRPKDELVQTHSFYPGVRESQRQVAAKVPHTGMAAAIDIGDLYNVHPIDKADVAARLVLAARHVAYGEELVHSGPDYSSMKVEDSRIRISFNHVAGGLKIAMPPWVSQSGTQPPANQVTGFAIAGADQKFVWADAKIEGDTVVVWNAAVPQPVAVRYAWANYPTVNLYNQANLPAVPFRTDDW